MTPEFYHIQNEFLKNVIEVIEQNLEKEDFSVEELAEAVNMSRSNLLRRIKKTTDLSVSRLIRKIRLHHAKEFLKDDSFSISEISYKVGFGSVSYFIKCFREQYGYPPGEEGKRPEPEQDEPSSEPLEVKSGKPKWMIPAVVVILIGLLGSVVFFNQSNDGLEEPLEKSIAVLPFKNDSQDSTNLYLINGLMEAILNNLQKIEDLRVVSRTSVEKYRNQTKSIPEIAEELDVSYFVEGSGQKIGDQILLTIQLIEAPRDQHLWSERYDKEVKDIFSLQMEVATDIAGEIQAIITPEEQQRIEKIPTDNMVAYDHFLKGLDYLKDELNGSIDSAIYYFEQAINEDDQFAQPYAYIAVSYYFKDLFQIEKKHTDDINTYADKAMFLDAEQGESLIAKALFYMQDEQYDLAIEYFERVLEYNPNSGWTYNFLSEIYTNYIPNTKKYLVAALKGVKLGIDRDSVTTSYAYLHLANALMQSGFIEESEKHIKSSMDFNPNNLFSEYVYAYILMAKDLDLDRTKELLVKTYERDTTRADVIQEVAKICYSMEDYEEADYYYKKFLQIKEFYQLDFFNSENAKIGFVLNQLGKEKGAYYLEEFRGYAENDESIFQELHLSTYYAALGDVENGMMHLKKFSQQENYHYWLIFLSDDPILKVMKDHPDYMPTMEKISENFWKNHDEIKEILKEEGLL